MWRNGEMGEVGECRAESAQAKTYNYLIILFHSLGALDM